MSKVIKYYIVFNVVCVLIFSLAIGSIFLIPASKALSSKEMEKIGIGLGLVAGVGAGAWLLSQESPFTQFSGRITYAMPCIPTPPDGICKNCTVCAAMAGPYTCAAYMEVQFTPFLGNQMIPPVVCPLIGRPYKKGPQTPTVGGQISGLGLSPLLIYDVALSL